MTHLDRYIGRIREALEATSRTMDPDNVSHVVVTLAYEGDVDKWWATAVVVRCDGVARRHGGAWGATVEQAARSLGEACGVPWEER